MLIKYLLFVAIRYRVSLSYMVNNTVQYIITHYNNLLDDYSSMDLLMEKSDTVGSFKVNTPQIKFTAVIEIPE